MTKVQRQMFAVCVCVCVCLCVCVCVCLCVCVDVCCSVLHDFCSVSQGVAVNCSALHWVTVIGGQTMTKVQLLMFAVCVCDCVCVLKYVAVCCMMLQCV